MRKKYRSDAMAAIHETMEGLHDAGAIDKQTMGRFDEDCLTAIRALRPEEMKTIREREAAVRQLQVKLERGVGQAERGELIDGDAVFEELREMIDERRRSEAGRR